MREFRPSYAEYRKILADIKATGRLMDFSAAEKADRFVILRHDIEFSITKAYEMALLEAESGVKSCYFVQLGTDAYNAFSDTNSLLLRRISGMGHKIGLHYRQGSSQCVVEQCQMLEQFLGVKVDSFSIHRPQGRTAYHKISVLGLHNAYSAPYFTRTENYSDVRVKYVSDSKFRWNYGYPDAELFMTYAKVQVLIHPFSWSIDGCDGATVFARLAHEKQVQLERVFRNEFSRYAELLKASEK